MHLSRALVGCGGSGASPVCRRCSHHEAPLTAGRGKQSGLPRRPASLGALRRVLLAAVALVAAACPRPQALLLSATGRGRLRARESRAAPWARSVGAFREHGRRRGALSSSGGAGVRGAGNRPIQRKAIFTGLVEELPAVPNIFIAEIATVVVLSTLFEVGEHAVRKQMAATGDETGQKILNALFKEVTSLGYIGLFLWLATRSGAAENLEEAMKLREPGSEEHILAETFETVHVIIFMLLTVLLLQSAAVLVISFQVRQSWDEYERARAFGAAEDSLESKFVKSGYLSVHPDATKPRGVELEFRAPFTYGDSLLQRVLIKREDPIMKLVQWRAIRHEFLFPASKEEMPKPRFFSFEKYLGEKFGSSVMTLVEVDQVTWVITLLVMVPIVYYCITVDFFAVEEVLCAFAWLLLAAAVLLAVLLEEETFRLTPRIPQDARQILRLLEGTNATFPAGSMKSGIPMPSPVPGLGGAENEPIPRLLRPLAYAGTEHGETSWYEPSGPPSAGSTHVFAPTSWYERAFRIIAFWQACVVTALIVAYLAEPLQGFQECAIFALACLEWPIMLFEVVPVLLRRFTIRNSIERKKDQKLIRKVTLKTKEGLLRNYVRLVQIISMERRAVGRQEDWTVPGGTGWSAQHARRMFDEGLQGFRELHPDEQLDIWKIYATWDANNDEKIDSSEFAEMLFAMGYGEHAPKAACNLIRFVDHDGTETLSWRKFKALFTLATHGRPPREQHEDISGFFSLMDADGNDDVTVDELSKWACRSKLGMKVDEFATLLYNHFDKPKASLSKSEFVEWMQAI